MMILKPNYSDVNPVSTFSSHESYLFPSYDLIYVFMCIGVCMYISMTMPHHLNWNYRQLGAATWGLGTESKSPG